MVRLLWLIPSFVLVVLGELLILVAQLAVYLLTAAKWCARQANATTYCDRANK